MAGLFGTAASTSASNTIGDLKNDVAIANPPEDTTSDLAFSPTSDILAVSSWDSKVRIYQIAANGTSEGKHIYEHGAPVLSVDFSKVLSQTTKMSPSPANLHHRMEANSYRPAQIKWPKSATYKPFRACKSQHMITRSSQRDSSSYPIPVVPCLSPVRGTRRSNTGI
jgi:WD40 repeat protein